MGTLAEELSKFTGRALPESTKPTITIPARYTPREVISRRKLWGDATAVFIIIVPANAKAVTPKTLDFKYLQLPPRPVEGGVVNVYLHDDDPKRNDPSCYVGKTITTTLEVWEKVFDDGKKFLYIDLYPIVATRKRPTHTFKVSRVTIPATVQMNVRAKGQIIFEMPPPMRGNISIAPKRN